MKENKNKLKSYKIKRLADAIMVLGTLIAPSIIHINKYLQYTEEVRTLYYQYMGMDCVPCDTYENLCDKIMFRQRELFTLMADEANNVFSYKKLRRDLKKRGFITSELDREVAEVLNELNMVRNWTFHNVQSHLVAEIEFLEKSIPPELSAFATIEPQLNPIIVHKYVEYKTDLLLSLLDHNRLRITQFSIVLDSMKKDYQDMFDKLDHPNMVINQEFDSLIEDCKSDVPVKVWIQEQVYGAKGNEYIIPHISMAIQKGKYDGTKGSFDKNTGMK